MRRIVVTFVVVVLGVNFLWAQATDTPKAAESRKLLQTKIAVDYNDTCCRRSPRTLPIR